METQAIDDYNEDSDASDSPKLTKGKVLAFLDCQGQRFELYEGDNIVGRSNVKDIEVKLADDTVSDVHANLELTESGECICRDLASNNGKRIRYCETILLQSDIMQ
jgi:pSer/pThr/pTyr-binding forkhead associated (FHA) protein